MDIRIKKAVLGLVSVVLLTTGCSDDSGNYGPPLSIVRSITICAKIISCDQYNSSSGLMQFNTFADGAQYSVNKYGGSYKGSKLFETQIPLNPLGDHVTCKEISLMNGDFAFVHTAFKLEQTKLIYAPSTGSGPVMRDGKQLVLNPTLKDIDFEKRFADVEFDCNKPQAESLKIQLGKAAVKQMFARKLGGEKSNQAIAIADDVLDSKGVDSRMPAQHNQKADVLKNVAL